MFETVSTGISSRNNYRELWLSLYLCRSTADYGRSTIVKVNQQDFEIDNRWIVPYYPILSKAFNAHINDESCYSIIFYKIHLKIRNKGKWHGCDWSRRWDGLVCLNGKINLYYSTCLKNEELYLYCACLHNGKPYLRNTLFHNEEPHSIPTCFDNAWPCLENLRFNEAMWEQV